MFGLAFINRMCQRWQDKPWIKLDDVTPYNFRHRHQRGCLDFVGEYHFRRYCDCGTTNSIWAGYKNAKKRKLYWKLHPQYKKW